MRLFPTVSVVIPAYNSEKTIKNAIKSFLRQSHPPREIIVIDDGSTDRTVAIVKSIKSESLPITIHSFANNHGPAYARNDGLKKATAEIIYFAESDGVYSRHFIKKQVEALQNLNEKSFAGGGLRICLREEERWADFWDALFEARWWLLRQKRLLPRGGWMFYRESLIASGGYNETMREGEDTELTLRLIRSGYNNIWVPDIFIKHLEPQSLKMVFKRFYRAGKQTITYRVANKTLMRDVILSFAILMVALMVPLNIVVIPFIVLLRLEVRIAWFRIWKRIVKGKSKLFQGLIFPYQYYTFKLSSSVGVLCGVASRRAGFL